MTVQHRAAVQELRDMHNITMATLHEEHARTMRGMVSAPTTAIIIIIIIHCVFVIFLDLRKAHEQQKLLLEEDFEKLRLSLQVRFHQRFQFCLFLLLSILLSDSYKCVVMFWQDQVDTLTFQNKSLRDKAKRFEDALRRSTDEQIIVSFTTKQKFRDDN